MGYGSHHPWLNNERVLNDVIGLRGLVGGGARDEMKDLEKCIQ